MVEISCHINLMIYIWNPHENPTTPIKKTIYPKDEPNCLLDYLCNLKKLYNTNFIRGIDIWRDL